MVWFLNGMPRIRQLSSALCLLSVFILSSCSMSKRVEYSDLEGRIPDNFFNTIETYPVSMSWLESQLGKAHMVQDGPRDQVILTYKLVSQNIEQVNYMWLIRSSETEVSQQYFHFIFIDDKLASHWSDSFAQVSFNAPPVNTTFIRDEIVLVEDKNQDSANEEEVVLEEKERMTSKLHFTRLMKYLKTKPRKEQMVAETMEEQEGGELTSTVKEEASNSEETSKPQEQMNNVSEL